MQKIQAKVTKKVVDKVFAPVSPREQAEQQGKASKEPSKAAVYTKDQADQERQEAEGGLEEGWEIVEYSPEEENKERLLLERYQQLLREKEQNEQKRREEKERREKLREDLFPRATKDAVDGDEEEEGEDFGLVASAQPGQQSGNKQLPTPPNQQPGLSTSQSAKRVNFANNNSNTSDPTATNPNPNATVPKLSVPVNKAGFLKKFGKPSELIQSPKKRFFILDVKSRSLAYYEKPKAKGEVGSPIGMIPLAAVSQPAQLALKGDVSSSSVLGKEFYLFCNGRKFVIIAASNQEALDWIAAINAVIDMGHEHPLAASNSAPKRQTTMTSTIDDFKEEIAMLRTNIAKTQEIMQALNHDDLENKIKIGNLEAENQRLTAQLEELKADNEKIKELAIRNSISFMEVEKFVEQTKVQTDEVHRVELEKQREEGAQQLEKVKDSIAKNVELLIHQYDEDIETMKREFERNLQDSLKREEEMRSILETERKQREEELTRLRQAYEGKSERQLPTTAGSEQILEDASGSSVQMQDAPSETTAEEKV